MSSGAFGPGGGHGGGRRGGRGCGRGRWGGHGCGCNWSGLEDPLPRRPGLHFHRELALPLVDRTRGTIANVVMSISFS